MKWSERIDRAEERGGFTAQDRRDAHSWAFCAVGEAMGWNDKANTEKVNGTPEPVQLELNALGTHFYVAVTGNNTEVARNIHRRIHELMSVDLPMVIGIDMAQAPEEKVEQLELVLA